MTEDASLVDFISERHLRYTLPGIHYSYLVHVYSRIYTCKLHPRQEYFVSRQETLALFLKSFRITILTTTHLMPRRTPLRAARCLCADLLVAATTNLHSASLSFCNVLSKLLYKCECTGDTPCLLRASDSNYLTFSPLFGPDRTPREHLLREAGPDWEHLLAETCIDIHRCGCRCRTKNEACCCCSRMGSRHEKKKITTR